MKQNKVIGITGGIATGKSTAVEYLKTKGYPVIDADLIARDVVEPGSVGLQAVAVEFGQDMIVDGALDRKALGAIVFSDEAKRQALNAILHPLIYAEMKARIEASNEVVVFVDSPLLFEGREAARRFGLDYDEVWLVDLDEDRQLSRLMARNGLSQEEARQRMNAQWSMTIKRALADVILDNRDQPAALYRQLDAEIHRIEEAACGENK
jgi:dephospho-CoA kinase